MMSSLRRICHHYSLINAASTFRNYWVRWVKNIARDNYAFARLRNRLTSAAQYFIFNYTDCLVFCVRVECSICLPIRLTSRSRILGTTSRSQTFRDMFSNFRLKHVFFRAVIGSLSLGLRHCIPSYIIQPRDLHFSVVQFKQVQSPQWAVNTHIIFSARLLPHLILIYFSIPIKLKSAPFELFWPFFSPAHSWRQFRRNELAWNNYVLARMRHLLVGVRIAK